MLCAVIGAASAQYASPGQQSGQSWSPIASEGASSSYGSPSSAPQASPMNMPVDNGPVGSGNSASGAPFQSQDSSSSSSFQGATVVHKFCTCVNVDVPAAPQAAPGASSSVSGSIDGSCSSAAAPMNQSADTPLTQAQPAQQAAPFAQQAYGQQSENPSARVRG